VANGLSASPCLQALTAAYVAKARVSPDTDSIALLAFVAAFASRTARDGEPAQELLFVSAVLRKAALDLPRLERRAEALKSVRGPGQMHRIDIEHAPTGLTARKSLPIQCD
jgi:hypothetical protein